MSQVKPPQITGRGYWRSLEEYADSPQFRELLGYAGTPIDPQTTGSGVSRRRFLQLMGASMSLAGLSLAGCRRWPEQTLAPYANRPEGSAPGVPTYYATMMEQAGSAVGLLAESYDGRPIKIEGNPSHPDSLGATDVWAQASVLTLYDPDRSRRVIETRGDQRQAHDMRHFDAFVAQHFGPRRGQSAGSVAVLAQPSSSPSRQVLKQQFQSQFPDARWYEWAPLNRDNVTAGSRLAFGQPLRAQYDLTRAKVLACFDADPLSDAPAALRNARQWAASRKPVAGAMNRTYAIEPTFTTTGSVADLRLPARASAVPGLLRAVAGRLGMAGGESVSLNGSTGFIDQLAADLAAHPGESLVIVGPNQPAGVHALAWAINEHLGAFGRTVSFTSEPAANETSLTQQITELTGRMRAGEIDTLVILEGNPVYDAPADLDFDGALGSVATSIHLSQYVDETSTRCTWHVPQAHYLEAWGDGRAWDGTVGVQQPLILPLYGGRSPIELLSLINGDAAEGLAIVRATFAAQFLTGINFENRWRRALHEGLLEGTQFETVSPSVNAAGLAQAVQSATPQAADSEFEIVFQRDPSLYDGRWANNGWLQEVPKSITKLTWDNCAQISVSDAERLGLKRGDMVELTVATRKLTLPVMITPGHANGSIVVTLGYGRRAAGHVGGATLADGAIDTVGFDTYRLRGTDGLGIAPVALSATSGWHDLVTTTDHDLITDVGVHALDARIGRQGESGKIIREGTLAQYAANPRSVHPTAHGNLSLQLYEPPHEFNDPHAWGMSIDMNACIGCNACVVACQAENNIPVVGKDQVKVNREMHWLRIDRYFKGDPAGSPDLVYQPMMCVHCENAPCEQVCPVNATMHDSEGLNVQVYNRCIGTRYCSNNCPYKVRRFNYFDYHSKDPRGAAKPWLNVPDTQQLSTIDKIKQMVFNPDVTVRMRGVMEKCTYCIQRIKRTSQQARRDYEKTRRGEPGYQRDSAQVQDSDNLVTACQQACPTQAIVFGNLNDPESRVSQLHMNNRTYEVLDDLNTKPRTRHMAKIRNRAETAPDTTSS